MASCGACSTAAVTADGDIWMCGTFGSAALSLPSRLIGAAESGSSVVAADCGLGIAAAVLADGTVLQWGDGECEDAVYGNEVMMHAPVKLFCASVAVMNVACGLRSTLAAVADGGVFSWGCGDRGQLGHGDRGDRSAPSRVCGFDGPVCRVAAGEVHSLASTPDGDMWSWGGGPNGQLGHGDESDRLEPALLPRDALGLGAVAVMAGGESHTVVACQDGSLFSWGKAADGRLGLGKHVRDDQLEPVRVHLNDKALQQLQRMTGNEAVDGELKAPIFTEVACGGKHSLALTQGGVVFAWGRGASGRLGLRDRNTRYTPTPIDPGIFAAGAACLRDASSTPYSDSSRMSGLGTAEGTCVPPVVSVAAGEAHSTAVLTDGSLWSWGRGSIALNSGVCAPAGLGHGDLDDRLAPSQVPGLPRLVTTLSVGGVALRRAHALAFAMATHPRLGGASVCVALTDDLVPRVIAAAGGVLSY